MKNFKITILNILITLLVGFILFYLFLPSINIHNFGFWFYLMIIIFVYGFLNSFKGIMSKNKKMFFDIKKMIPFSIIAVIFVMIMLVSFFNSAIFMSKKYYQRITIDSSIEFKDCVNNVDFNSLALLDKSSSQKLGSNE